MIELEKVNGVTRVKAGEPLSKLFDFPIEDPLNLYPFEARCIAVDWTPQDYPMLLNVGRNTIDFVYSRSTVASRQIRFGLVVLFMPERWLSLTQQQGLMSGLCDVHEVYPLKRVDIITRSMIIVSDFSDAMVRLVRKES